MEILRLNDAIPQWPQNGIFYALSSYDVPWAGVFTDHILDFDYFGNWSGNKIVSPLVDVLVSNNVLSDAHVTTLASLIYNLYNGKWSKLWATNNLEYNPISNYDMVEVMTNDSKVTVYGRGVSKSVSSTDSNNVFGFNTTAENGVPADKSTSTGSESSSTSGQDSETRNYRLTRSGNIGVTTSQQMIESERELWKLWDIMREAVYPDVDKILTISTY